MKSFLVCKTSTVFLSSILFFIFSVTVVLRFCFVMVAKAKALFFFFFLSFFNANRRILFIYHLSPGFSFSLF